MAKRILGTGWLLLVSLFPLCGQEQDESAYRLIFDADKDVSLVQQDESGKAGILVNIRFVISQVRDTTEDVQRDYKVLIKEDGRVVKEVDVPAPTINDAAVMLAVDMSGSMTASGKVTQARQAGGVFFDRLPDNTDCGLLIFDHELRKTLPPGKDREPLRKELNAALPGGGTAYLDATMRSIELLRVSPIKNKIAVVMTDGVDLNSKHKAAQLVQKAREAGVKVYTIGIGEPGKNEPVTTVLAIDKSSSMKALADPTDKVSRIEAAKRAANRFVEIMRPNARTTLMEFAGTVDKPRPFANDREALRKQIASIQLASGTAFRQAAFDAIQALVKENAPGKKAVVVLTDGGDSRSKIGLPDVIAQAKKAGIPLHMLAVGRDSDIEVGNMQRMAKETGGQYYQATSEKALVQIFENLSIQLHDDGVDEQALRQLAESTGGQYFAARDISNLRNVLGEVSERIQNKSHEITFPSLRQVADGTRRAISVELVRRGLIVQTEAGTTQVHGLIVAEMSPFWYLTILVVLGMFLVVPVGMRSVLKR